MKNILFSLLLSVISATAFAGSFVQESFMDLYNYSKVKTSNVEYGKLLKKLRKQHDTKHDAAYRVAAMKMAQAIDQRDSALQREAQMEMRQIKGQADAVIESRKKTIVRLQDELDDLLEDLGLQLESDNN